MATTSTATLNQTEVENPFEQPQSSSQLPHSLNCLTEIVKVLQEWCRSCRNDLERICSLPFRMVSSVPGVVQQTLPDPQNAFDQLAPISASTSAEPWQIFINHRGIDVKYTFAKRIYQTLDGMGFRVFLDIDAFEPGDVIPAEIQAAMSTASLHIAIFSLNYAQSPWCLAELAFMLKNGSKIIPIFYHVDPSDLRWVQQGKGKYARAFSEHAKKGRYTEEKLKEWKGALYNISFYSGYEVSNNEDEAIVLKNIVNCALKVIQNVPLWVAEHPLGLDELVEGFQSVASEDRVKITGIVGMGGSGKTTLAKEIFNRNFSSFERCSFVSDVREAASRSVLPDKQKKLLKDLGVHHLPFDSVDEGMAILANRLSSHRALIVLDDVDHIDHLNALLPNRDSIGSQSIVIVTTRELGVLKSWGLSCIYKMPGLNRSHAEQLFCWHAFLQPSPPAQFGTLVEEVLKACDGLPLSLKVLGAQLYGRESKDYWKSLLHKLSRILPGDIQKRLQLSYDALDGEEREMFLDVACFFVGERKSTAIAVWDGMDLSGLYGLQTLLDKCLVELVYEEDYALNNIVYGEKIRMHDHLRDMGRQIASRHSSYRLWWPEQIHNLKKHFKKEIPIRGIRPSSTFLAFKEYKHRLMGISNGLQLLHVEGNEFTEEFASLSEDLVWLQWKDFPLKNLPPWLTLRHLSVLELLAVNEFEELWDDNVEPPLQLRKLDISGGSRLQRLPTSIGRLQYLQMLSLDYRGSSLPKEFCGLHSLEYLHLYCPKLCSLPAAFGHLINLKYVDLTFCVQLSTLPDSFDQLIQLEHLSMSCSLMPIAFCSLPYIFGNLRRLKHITLNWCNQLITLPNCFTQLRRLEDVDLALCAMLSSLPAGFGSLVSLKYIDLMGCSMLRALPDSFKQLIHLEHLELSGCAKLKLKSDAFENIRKLKFLGLRNCKELEDLPSQIVIQASLTELDLTGCIKLRGSPSNISQLVNLQSLKSECPMLKSLQTPFVSFSSLKDIQIVTSESKMEFDVEEEESKEISRVSISNDCCPNLQHFEVRSNTNFQIGEFQKNLLLMEIETLPVSLKRLSIYNCKVLKKISCLSGLVNLEELSISGCPQLKELSSFTDLVSLKEFSMYECSKVQKLEGLQNSKSLKRLRLLGTRWKAPGIQSLEKVEGLETLELECDTISALKPCIQSMKEFPREMSIQGSVSHFVEHVVNSLDFPDLVVTQGKRPSDDGAHYFRYVEGNERNGEERKVVQIYVRLGNAARTEGPYNNDIKIEKEVLVWGERGRVVEAFYQLLELLE